MPFELSSLRQGTSLGKNLNPAFQVSTLHDHIPFQTLSSCTGRASLSQSPACGQACLLPSCLLPPLTS
jgi:hypothetical protein